MKVSNQTPCLLSENVSPIFNHPGEHHRIYELDLQEMSWNLLNSLHTDVPLYSTEWISLKLPKKKGWWLGSALTLCRKGITREEKCSRSNSSWKELLTGPKYICKEIMANYSHMPGHTYIDETRHKLAMEVNSTNKSRILLLAFSNTQRKRKGYIFSQILERNEGWRVPLRSHYSPSTFS